MSKYVVSAGHGKLVSGAVGFLNEHKEAVRVMNKVHTLLGKKGYKYEETAAKTQSTNLSNIVKYHNSKERSLDISIHFNSSANATATGAECLYVNPKLKNLSAKMSKAMANALSINDRGPKLRNDLYVLNKTNKPAILLEVCFVSCKDDANKYNKNFNALCEAIAKVIADYIGLSVQEDKPQEETSKPVQKPSTTKKKHTVKRGESLYSLAKTYKATVTELRQWNGLTNNDIYVGDVLYVADTATPKNDDYYGKEVIGKKVIAKTLINLYNSKTFNEKTVKMEYPKGSKFTVTGITYTSAGTPRLITASGFYITANKKYVTR